MIFQTHLMFHSIHGSINNYERFYVRRNDGFVIRESILLWHAFHRGLVFLGRA